MATKPEDSKKPETKNYVASFGMGCCGAATRIHATNENSLNGRYVPKEEQFGGPIKLRKCQDVIFLIIFVAVLTLVINEYYKIPKNDVIRIKYGIDDNGNICGIKNEKFRNISASGQDMTDKEILKSCDRFEYVCQEPSECVSECPKGYKRYSFIIINQCRPDYEEKSYHKSTKYTLSSWIEDIAAYKSDIIYLCTIAFFINFIILLSMRFFAGAIIWIIIGTVGFGLLLLTILLWLIWKNRYTLSEKAMGPDHERLNFESYMFYTISIISTISMVIYMIIIISMKKKIHLVASLFEEAGKAIRDMPMLLFQPLWTIIFATFVIWFWFEGVMTFYYASKPYVVQREIIYPPSRKYLKDMMMYYSMAFAWVLKFVLDCQDVIISSAIAEWYFSRDKSKLISPIFRSLNNLLSYHLGSVVLGSAIITAIKILRIVLKRIEKLAKDRSHRLIGKYCKCSLKISQNFLIYVNRNAYIEIAIYGYGFCKSAQRAFSVLINNALKVIVINSVGDFVLLMSKCAVIIITSIIGLKLFQNKDDLNNIMIPILIACFFAYVVSSCFISVYEMVIDSLFICFCEDCERNDGIERPYFMSKSLMIFVEKNKEVADIPQLYTKSL